MVSQSNLLDRLLLWILAIHTSGLDECTPACVTEPPHWTLAHSSNGVSPMDSCFRMYYLLECVRLNADIRKLELTSPTPPGFLDFPFATFNLLCSHVWKMAVAIF